jgi:hypothetical protein
MRRLLFLFQTHHPSHASDHVSGPCRPLTLLTPAAPYRLVTPHALSTSQEPGPGMRPSRPGRTIIETIYGQRNSWNQPCPLPVYWSAVLLCWVMRGVWKQRLLQATYAVYVYGTRIRCTERHCHAVPPTVPTPNLLRRGLCQPAIPTAVPRSASRAAHPRFAVSSIQVPRRVLGRTRSPAGNHPSAFLAVETKRSQGHHGPLPQTRTCPVPLGMLSTLGG